MVGIETGPMSSDSPLIGTGSKIELDSQFTDLFSKWKTEMQAIWDKQLLTSILEIAKEKDDEINNLKKERDAIMADWQRQWLVVKDELGQITKQQVSQEAKTSEQIERINELIARFTTQEEELMLLRKETTMAKT